MLKFELKGNNQWKYWNLSKKWEVQQMFMFFAKFDQKNLSVGNWSKCPNLNLSANHQIVQNDVLWVKSLESIKKLTFGCNKVGIDQNVEILMQNVKSIKMMKYEWKFDIDQMLIFYCQSVNQSKCWNLIEK